MLDISSSVISSASRQACRQWGSARPKWMRGLSLRVDNIGGLEFRSTTATSCTVKRRSFARKSSQSAANHTIESSSSIHRPPSNHDHDFNCTAVALCVIPPSTPLFFCLGRREIGEARPADRSKRRETTKKKFGATINRFVRNRIFIENIGTV